MPNVFAAARQAGREGRSEVVWGRCDFGYDFDKYHQITNCLIHEVGCTELSHPKKPRLPAGEATPRGANNWEPTMTFSLARSSNPARETCATFPKAPCAKKYGRRLGPLGK